MKTQTIIAGFALAILSTLNPQLSTCRAQGSLTPPGAPAPVMKSLDQIEPRTIVNAVNTPGDSGDSFVISQPGSYYLAANLTGASGKNGIEIATNNVTLDLNGFALTGAGSGNGIYLSTAQANVTVRNGSLSGWSSGLAATGNSRNLILENLAVSSCGYGIWPSCPVVVRDCFCASNNLYGICAPGGGQIVDSDASYNGSDGIYIANGVVRNCRAGYNGEYGIRVAPGMVTGCYVHNNVHSGICVYMPESEAIGNTCFYNNTSESLGDAGIFVDDSNNRIEDNHVSGSYAGISVASIYYGNIIIKNSVSGNGANNYLTPGNQIVGPLINNYGTITNSNPWANFSFP